MTRLAVARRRADRVFVLALAALALLAVAKALVVRPTTAQRPNGRASRQVDSTDEAEIRRLILEGRLSDHEALHYRKIPARPGQ